MLTWALPKSMEEGLYRKAEGAINYSFSSSFYEKRINTPSPNGAASLRKLLALNASNHLLSGFDFNCVHWKRHFSSILFVFRKIELQGSWLGYYQRYKQYKYSICSPNYHDNMEYMYKLAKVRLWCAVSRTCTDFTSTAKTEHWIQLELTVASTCTQEMRTYHASSPRTLWSERALGFSILRTESSCEGGVWCNSYNARKPESFLKCLSAWWETARWFLRGSKR